jgi:hypothetical protein
MTSSQSQEIFTNNQRRNTLSKLIEECNNESDIDKKIQLFYNLNSKLPLSYQVNIPLYYIGYIRIYTNLQSNCNNH